MIQAENIYTFADLFVLLRFMLCYLAILRGCVFVVKTDSGGRRMFCLKASVACRQLYSLYLRQK